MTVFKCNINTRVAVVLAMAGVMLGGVTVEARQLVTNPTVDAACGGNETVFVHDVWQSVLTQAVGDDGEVDLPEAKILLPRLNLYLDQVARISPESHPQCFPRQMDHWAYWMNVYNAQALRLSLLYFPAMDGKLRLNQQQVEAILQQGFYTGGRVTSLGRIYTDRLTPLMDTLGPEVFWSITTHHEGENRPLAPKAFQGHTLRTQLKETTRLAFRRVVAPQEDRLLYPKAALQLPQPWLMQRPAVEAYLKQHPERGLDTFEDYAWQYVSPNTLLRRGGGATRYVVSFE